jgi:antirestriction protein ArdC
MTTATAEKTDIYAKVTNRIIEDLEKGERPWMKPWNAEHAAGRITRPLRHSGEPYRGINVLMLWASAEMQGFACPLWLTFRQALELGGCVKKGSKGTPVVYSASVTRADRQEDGEEADREIRFMKQYTVFNAEQVEGLPERFYALAEPPTDGMTPHERAERFFAGTGADIRHGGNLAYYAIAADAVQLPPFVTFRDPESYAAVVAHELTHWTRHPKRLDRDLGRKRFGDEGYAMEELVAEIGAAFLCADLGVTPEVREDHAAYLASWLKVLKGDKRAVFTAAALAERAVGYLHAIQPTRE